MDGIVEGIEIVYQTFYIGIFGDCYGKTLFRVFVFGETFSGFC